VVIIHGGGWVEGSKEELRATAIFMAMRGYVAVSIDYRLAPKYRFPAQLEDAKCAVRWLRANAEKYQIDGDRIGAIGGSAGAHLALLLGFTGSGHEFDGTGGHPEQSSRVAAVVNWMGPADLTSPDWPAATMIVIQDLIGSDQRTSPAAYRAASPLSYIRKGIPPVLSMYGTKDTVVPYDQATRLDAALRKAGVESKLETLKGIGHGEGLTALNLLRILQESADFLDSHMKSK
jgi:acetyl esterase/lipase